MTGKNMSTVTDQKRIIIWNLDNRYTEFLFGDLLIKICPEDT